MSVKQDMADDAEADAWDMLSPIGGVSGVRCTEPDPRCNEAVRSWMCFVKAAFDALPDATIVKRMTIGHSVINTLPGQDRYITEWANHSGFSISRRLIGNELSSMTVTICRSPTDMNGNPVPTK